MYKNNLTLQCGLYYISILIRTKLYTYKPFFTCYCHDLHLNSEQKSALSQSLQEKNKHMITYCDSRCLDSQACLPNYTHVWSLSSRS